MQNDEKTSASNLREVLDSFLSDSDQDMKVEDNQTGKTLEHDK